MSILNQYIKRLNRIEFVLTDACTGKCKHCSEGVLKGQYKLDAEVAARVLKTLADYYDIQSIMTFGGEPLICPESVAKIHETARNCKIPKRQIITNGCFSKDTNRIEEVACLLESCGVNDILLSIDCFHAEYLPLEWTRQFAEALRKYYHGCFRLQPSWVRDPNEDNPYNVKTKECLAYFDDLHIEHNEGDVIFPQGNAIDNLADYFEKKPFDFSFKCGQALYSTKLDEIDELSIDSNGDVVPCSFSIGNIYEQDIIQILKYYDPYENPLSRALLKNGIAGIIEETKKQGINIDYNLFYSPCAFCHAVANQLKKKNAN